MSEPAKTAIAVGAAVWFVFMLFVSAVMGLVVLADDWPEWAKALLFFAITTFLLSVCVGIVIWRSGLEDSDDRD